MEMRRAMEPQWLAICVTTHAEWTDFFYRLWDKRKGTDEHSIDGGRAGARAVRNSAGLLIASWPGHNQVKVQVRDDKLGDGRIVERRLLMVDASGGDSEIWKLRGRSFCGSWESERWMVGPWPSSSLLGVITMVESMIQTRNNCPHGEEEGQRPGGCNLWGMTEERQVWEWLGL